MLIALGIDPDGKRSILGVSVALSEAEVHWRDFLQSLINKLLVDLGKACSEYQDKASCNLSCKRIQCDEIWSFVGAKERNTTAEKKDIGWGDVWTWVAMDADSKLIPTWFIGTRDAGAAYHFMHDLAERLANRVQLTTDGHKAYLSAVEDAFGANIDYAMLVKIYGNAPEGAEVRYSPAVCMGARKAARAASLSSSTSPRATWSARTSRCG